MIKLLKHADVFITNVRRAGLERLGLDYEYGIYIFRTCFACPTSKPAHPLSGLAGYPSDADDIHCV